MGAEKQAPARPQTRASAISKLKYGAPGRAKVTALPNASLKIVRKQIFWLGLVLLVTCVVYLPALRGQFTNYDDDLYILQNPMIRNLDWAHFKDLFSTIYQNQYSPIAMLIMAIEVKTFGVTPAAIKTVSVLFHVVNTLLVFQLIRQLFNRFDYAIITAGLFALHTLQVESVVWLAASMKIAAYSLFFFTSLLAYVRYLASKNPRWLILSLLLFLISCLCKEQAIVLPASLLAIDYLRARSLRDRGVLLEKIPFLIVAAIFAALSLKLTGKMQSPGMVHYYTAAERFLFVCFSFVSYVLKLVLPVNLSAFYTYPFKGSIPPYYYAAPVFGLFLLGALYVLWKKKQRILVFGIVFFVINIFLSLVSEVVSVRDVMMADRYVYVAAVGFFLIVAYVVVELLRGKPRLSAAIWAGLIGYGLLLSVLTWQRAHVWDNSITLFTDVIGKSHLEQGKYNPFLEPAFNNRGVAREQAGDRAGALADFDEAIKLNGLDPRPWRNRASVHFYAGEIEAALKDYSQSLELDDKNAIAYCGRGAAYGARNQFDLAQSDLNRAIELDPTLADAYRNRAVLYSNLKRFADTIADTDQYLRLRPNDPEMINMRALTLIEMNRLSEAEVDFNRAIQLKPGTGVFYLNRSRLYQRTNRKMEALQDAERAQSLGVKVSPQYLSSLR